MRQGIIAPQIRNLVYLAVSTSIIVPQAVLAATKPGKPSYKNLEEVVVTARKREETLFDVPMSLNVFSSDEIEMKGIEDTTNLIGRVPGLSLSGDLLSPGKDFAYLVTRGVGANTGGDPATPVFLDGVYQPRLGFDSGFMSVERIEILKGPQGSIFGRNSEGGAVNIVTKRPGPDFEGRISIEADDFSGHKTQLRVNTPVSDTFYTAIAVESQAHGSYLTNTTIGSGSSDANNGRTNSARIALNYIPNDSFSAYLSLDYSNFKGLNGLPGVRRGCDCYDVETEFQMDANDKNRGGSLHLKWNFDWAELSSITGYRYLSSRLPFDFDGGTRFSDNIHDFKSKQDFWSEELRLANSTESTSWLVGLYYFEEKSDSQRGYDLSSNPTLPGLFITDQDVLTDRQGYAVFANMDFSLSESFSLTLGARHSSESMDGDFKTDYTITSFDLHVIEADQESDRFNSLTGTASLKYYINDDVMSYFTVAQGFKAGGYPLAPISPLDFTSFTPEKSINYEAGLKAELADKRVNIKAAAYYIELEDQQLSTVIEINGLPVAATANAGSSHVNGFEFELSAAVSESLTFNSAVGYANTEFDDYTDSSGKQRAGESFRFTPELTGSASLDYHYSLQDGMDLSLSLSYRYVDDVIQGFGGLDTEFSVDDYQLIDISASLIDEQWQLQLYVNNVADEYVETRVWDAFFFSVDKSDSFSSVLPPRKIGLRFSYYF